MFCVTFASVVAVAPDIIATNIVCLVRIECNIAPTFLPICYTSVHKVRAPLETVLDARFDCHRSRTALRLASGPGWTILRWTIRADVAATTPVGATAAPHAALEKPCALVRSASLRRVIGDAPLIDWQIGDRQRPQLILVR